MLHIDPASLSTRVLGSDSPRQWGASFTIEAALTAAEIGIWQIDMDTGLATWDAVTSAMLGLGRVKQVEPRPMPIHPDDRADVAQRLEKNARGEGERDVEVRILRPDGEIRWVRSTARPLRCAAPAGRWVGGVVTDTTDRKMAQLALVESQRQLATLIDNLPGIAYRRSVGASWCMTYVSEGVELLTGHKPGEIMRLRKGWADLVYPEDLPALSCEVIDGVAAGRMFSMSYRIVDRRGAIRWVLERGRAAYDATGKAIFLEGFIGDITEQKQVEESLLGAQLSAERSAQRVHEVLENTSDCVYSIDEDWRFTYLNRRAKENFDNKPLLGKSVHGVFPDSRDSIFRSAFDEAMVYRRPAWREGYLPSRQAWYDVNIVPSESGATVFYRDITARKQSEERILWLANHDPLTQLPNRLLFQERLDAMIGALGTGASFALLVIDVDDFKLVNDTLGHDAGDTLLCTFATRLSEAVRAGDTVARLGGDEFAIILQGVSSEADIEKAVEGIFAKLHQPLHHLDKVLDCSASIGASLSYCGSASRVELLKQADLAVYAAKAAGRSNLQIFRPSMRGEMQSRMSMIGLARNALKMDRVQAFYQPKVDLRTGRYAGFEALLRWEDLRGGIHTPSTIAAAFEDVSLATEISQRMIDQVIDDMCRWQRDGVDFGHVAINSSAAEFRKGDFAETLLERISAAALTPELFQLEVTETVFLGRGADHVERALRTLSAAGVKIALDDFGTGYASLSHLKQFPVEILKIDRSFVNDLEIDVDAAAIIGALVSLGKSLGIEVVAEGVETEAQHAHLAAKGCEYGQGFLYSAAVPGSEVAELLGNQPLRHFTQR